MSLHGSSAVRIGLLCPEPILFAGLLSAFDGEPTIEIFAGELEALVANRTLGLLIVCAGRGKGDESACLETQLLVHRLRPDMGQIVIGAMEDEDFLLRSLSAGARAYVDINTDGTEIRAALEAVLQGSIWAPPRMLSLLIDRLLDRPGARLRGDSIAFSPREQQVLALIMSACSNREIATELGIEERTVKAHVASLLRKTGAENRVSLSVRATQESLHERRPTVEKLVARGADGIQ